MDTAITIAMMPSADGMLHLVVPETWRERVVLIRAQLAPDAVNAPERANPGATPSGFGCLKGQIWMAPDFDAPLQEFEEYM